MPLIAPGLIAAQPSVDFPVILCSQVLSRRISEKLRIRGGRDHEAGKGESFELIVAKCQGMIRLQLFLSD